MKFFFKVVVCENNVNVYDINSGGRPYFYANLRHELVHAFDNCRAKMTPNTSDPNFCKQIACSEVCFYFLYIFSFF